MQNDIKNRKRMIFIYAAAVYLFWASLYFLRAHLAHLYPGQDLFAGDGRGGDLHVWAVAGPGAPAAGHRRGLDRPAQAVRIGLLYLFGTGSLADEFGRERERADFGDAA